MTDTVSLRATCSCGRVMALLSHAIVGDVMMATYTCSDGHGTFDVAIYVSDAEGRRPFDRDQTVIVGARESDRL